MKTRVLSTGLCGLAFIGCATFMPSDFAFAEKPLGLCGFDMKSLSFRGTELEQAKCLLSPTKPAGHLGASLTTLPAPFEKVVGTPFKLDTSHFREYLAGLKVGPDALGGGLDEPLSRSAADNKPSAKYFVIHDVSYNRCDDIESLTRSDDPNAKWNLTSRWANSGEAHLYITRDGKLIAPQGRTFKVAYPATKLERQNKSRTRGLFLHVENVQLRTVAVEPGESAWVLDKKTKEKKCRNDRVAQQPGFTQIQYSRLALVYIAASHRAGKWLVPAYHLAIDKGVGDAHDDPQNFDLNDFGSKICGHLEALGRDVCSL